MFINNVLLVIHLCEKHQVALPTYLARSRWDWEQPSSLLQQGSNLGWSCGPSLPNPQSDHHIVLGGGPVVYWKTYHKRTVLRPILKKIDNGTDHLYAFIFFSVNVMYCKYCSNASYITRKGKLCQLCLI